MPQTSPMMWSFMSNMLIMMVIINSIFNNKTLTDNSMKMNMMINKNMNWKW